MKILILHQVKIIMVKSVVKSPPQQNYHQNGFSHDPGSANAFLQQRHQDPPRVHHNPRINAEEMSFRAKPQPEHVSIQPSVSMNYNCGRNQSSQIQQHQYSNHTKPPSGAGYNKVSVNGHGRLPNNKIPVNSPILWKLSQEIREWKFLGRYLDLEEDIIEEIDYNTIPNKTRDKALKVLTEWVNSSTPTWVALGEALLDAEYVMLYEKLIELIS